ncbi:bifunctional diaminohydroxyphosphoribosylaminopyrimidine deaminase/5-amino-6-(5-phosphoribosylamino)uracil reductase RibD [Rhodococcus sp. X156]|uniref:bifunctional diaminohydroxyphosphoribosylaminopyrimidine deaminase/5-amino-6-(5-phosphoribosylamino)uracil reductase RibD n=1 Tax=Rhodococcus sp. X156 TaxID=2499145 RepID=UPI000FD81603|nr:bifunctional diaminohydroxyphosphoribosylaminopyrimidine deaminase/5-amino-6-(5-phosphoribosylamino)uracil reductase RibD [Rhodococcus sp. X156]
MELAAAQGERVRGTTAPNPPVGCVILNAGGIVVGAGGTAPAGGPHAEVQALRQAGAAARGGTAVVTLEPCNHHGRTPPCTAALVEAGIAAVHYAVADPNPAAAGGAAHLAGHGVTAVHAPHQVVTRGALRAWLHRQRTGRPHVTYKLAATLDGRTAAADGTSRWVTGEQARAQVHAERAHLDAIVVGTGTVLADDPWLTARRPDGSLAAHQPLRVVVGTRELPRDAKVLDDSAETLLVRTHDPREVLAALDGLDDVLLEGGATLAGAFVAAGLVDRVVAYIAPTLLGSGVAALGDAGVRTMTDALQMVTEDVQLLGNDVRVSAVPRVSAGPMGGRGEAD